MIAWSPRLILTERQFRLPVVSAPTTRPALSAPGFTLVDERYSARDRAWMFYLRAPPRPGDVDIEVRIGDHSDRCSIQVRGLAQLREPFEYNGVTWPRRWPLEDRWSSRKTRQTLQAVKDSTFNEETLQWWAAQSDRMLWDHLPNCEFPRAHYVNVHQGCPSCGTAIFRYHGFYPWQRCHRPRDLSSECPACGSTYPSNDLLAGDFSSGDFIDDGFGYFDATGHVYLFAASSHRELVGQYSVPIRTLTARLRQQFDAEMARQLAILLLRWAQEEVYVAAAPQFRHGPSQEEETPWDGGQPDWASANDPVRSLYRKGSLAYAIDVPAVSEIHSLAYDTVWPLLRQDEEIVERVGALGLELEGPRDATHLIEESLAVMVQCAIDGAALSNKPRTSIGALTVLRALDRPDATDVMDWLYDRGPDRLRVFVTNNFTPDGVPPEATGGYNNTHTNGVFQLEEQIRCLRALHPETYRESEYPSLLDDPRIAAIVRNPYEVLMLDRVPLHFGDGGSAGVQTPLGPDPLEPLGEENRSRISSLLEDNVLPRRAVKTSCPRSTILDGAGFAILRCGENGRERASAGIVFGDAPWHRHMDLLDVQLYAHDRPYLSDLGYPQSWSSVRTWEGNWATHNSVWSVLPGVYPLELPFDTPWHFLKQIAGRGRLVRTMEAPGVQVVEVEAERWCFNAETLRWHRPGVCFRRLLALVQTDGDGVAVVDLSRVRGPGQHWRICRGMEGALELAQVRTVSLPGTLAGEGVKRGDLEAVEHPDHAGLAYMDNVHDIAADVSFRGSWRSRYDAEAQLDLHVLGVSAGTRIRTARATAVMGEPEESKYEYHALAFDRPAGTVDSGVDLVFEPRLGDSRLRAVEYLAPEPGGTATGITLHTREGRTVRLYWSTSGRGISRYADGAVLDGALAVCEDDESWSCGAVSLSGCGRHWSFPQPRQTGTIIALDRRACSVEVEGLEAVETGDRLCVNAKGRAATYRVEEARKLAPGRHHLRLDVASVLGRGRIVARDPSQCRLQIDFFLISRTGYLHEARLERESDSEWRRIEHAVNEDSESTVIDVETPLPGADGEWIRVVTYVVGDEVRLEAVRHGEDASHKSGDAAQ
ncbi:MAG: heparinase II/III family protein [Candidatus Latescibacterota bacterium]|nr:heparinase II/III family protein [Candidatus Latescibacterota bacterium]